MHFHLIVPDGVFVDADGGGLAFAMHPVPTSADVLAISLPHDGVRGAAP